jgi:drug/metabolite transporter (DMT)-like permease
MMALFIAFKLMALAGAIAISFSAPLFTTLLSVVLLKEKVGIHRWLALAGGFCGVLLVTHPGAGSFQVGALFGLTNAVMISTVAIAIRKMAMTETAETLLVYQLSFLAIFTALLLPFGAVVPAPADGILLALAGLLNGVSQYWWTKSLHLAPASVVVPFNYLSLVWASFIGFIVWGDVPAASLIGGSAIVVASGLYIFWRETGRRRAPA